MGKHGRYEKRKEPKLKKPAGRKKIILIVVAVILVLIAAVVIAGVIYYNHMLNQITRVDVPKIDYASLTEATEETEPVTEETEETEETVTETTEPHVASSADYINFLIVGQAAREGEEERFADTSILLTVNTYEKTLTMTSLLRDTLIQGAKYGIYTYGNIKLTTVYHLGYTWTGSVAGSMELMNLTLYNNFGIEVDHNFEIDFQGFIDVIDLLGGFDIELTQAEANYMNEDVNIDGLSEGVYHLGGYEALVYARMRKAEGDGESDIVRTNRQRKMIEAIIAVVKTKSISELQKLAEQALPYITTSMSNSEITNMLLTMLPMVSDLTIKSGGTCPAKYWGDYVDIYGDGVKHGVLRFNPQETKEYMRAITEGEGVIPEAE